MKNKKLRNNKTKTKKYKIMNKTTLKNKTKLRNEVQNKFKNKIKNKNSIGSPGISYLLQPIYSTYLLLPLQQIIQNCTIFSLL